MSVSVVPWRWRAPLLAAALSCLLTGCASNPVTGESTLNLMPLSWDRQVGAQQYAPSLQTEGGRYALDEDLGRYVSEVGQRLARHAELPLDYEFTVLNNDVPNAWALPGGKIAINRGLLTALESEAELAAVLGHEIVHAAARHGAQSQSRGVLLSGAVVATGIALQGKEYGQVAALGAGLGAALINTRYGRDAELEADAYGIRYMVAAGYDPQGAVDLQATFLELSAGRRQDWLSGLFASHPPSSQRLERNRELAAAYPRGGESGRQRYARAIADLQRTAPAYAAYRQGVEALAEGRTTQARRLALEALRIEPREGRFHGLLGDIAASRGDLAAAEDHFEDAIARDSGWYYHWLRRGIVRQSRGRLAPARNDLLASLERLPTGTAYFQLGLLEKRRGNRDQARRYLQTAQQAGGEIGQRATVELGRL